MAGRVCTGFVRIALSIAFAKPCLTLRAVIADTRRHTHANTYPAHIYIYCKVPSESKKTDASTKQLLQDASRLFPERSDQSPPEYEWSANDHESWNHLCSPAADPEVQESLTLKLKWRQHTNHPPSQWAALSRRVFKIFRDD